MARRDRTERVAVSLPREETAPEHWLRTIRFSGFSFLMLAVVILAVVVLAPNLRVLVEQRQQLSQLQETVDEAQANVDELNQNLARWEDPAYIVAQARDRLFYVFPGEQSFLVVGEASAVLSEDQLPISDQIQTTKVDWLGTLMGSIYTAGLTQATPEQLTPEG